jgi:hypothetical protein
MAIREGETLMARRLLSIKILSVFIIFFRVKLWNEKLSILLKFF